MTGNSRSEGRKWCKRVMTFTFLMMTSSLCALYANERSLTVIPLFYAVPEQVLPAVKAILSDHATVTTYNNQLILKATAKEKALVEELLQQIDKAPRQLLITVRTPRSASSQERHIGVEGTFDNGKVKIGNSDQPGRVIIRNNRSNSSRVGSQSVRATEGMPAYIATGTSQPVTSWRVDSSGYRERVTEYQPADRGFYVVPRLVGDQVMLDILQSDDEFSSHTIQKRRISTTISGALGEWLKIGSIGSQGSGKNQGLVIRNSDASNEVGTIELLVEKL